MYLSVPGPPAPPPPSWYCSWLKLGCPAAVAPNPDNLGSLYGGLQNELPTPGDPTGSMNSSSGMGCAGGECHCGGTCHGMGLFDSGTDFSGWGALEWGIVGLGVFGVFAAMSGAGRGARAVRKSYRRRKALKRLGA